MLYNKNNVRKTNDKKILHKVGKQWKVVSVALLMAIGGGAAVAATNNNANAQSTNGASVSVQSEAANLENDNYAAPKSASANTSSKASSTSAKAPSLASVNYAPSARVDGNNASAASYHNQDEFDLARINYYGPTVKSYVNSVNAKFPSTTSNLKSNYNTASLSATSDASLANSYSAAANNSANSSVVSNLASNAGLTTSAFMDSVKYEAPTFANAVKSASTNTTAMGLAYSVANEVSGMANNLPELAANVNVNSAIASAQYDIAVANSSATENAFSAAVKASANNDAVLTSATVDSIEASGLAQLALGNSYADATAVNSLAKSLSGSSAFNSSAVSSEVSYYASLGDTKADAYDFSSNFSGTSFGSKVTLSANNGSTPADKASDVAFNSMKLVITDTYNMNDASARRALDNSLITSAKAAKASYAANVTATSLAAKNTNNGISSLSAKSAATSVEAKIFNSLGTNSASALSVGENLLNNIAANHNLKADFANAFGLNGNDKAGLYDLAKASGVDVNTMLNDKAGIEGVATAIANGYHNASAAAAAKGNNDSLTKVSALSSAMSSVATSTENALTNAQSASNSYANAVDENVTLASHYASSYSNDAKSEATVASDAAKDLDNFYLANTDANFASADANFEAAKKAEPNDATLAHAFGVNVLHNSPQFITLTANAMLHSAANYTKKNGVKAVKAGESFAVKGVAFDEAGNIRYVVGESDNNPVYLTGNDSYVENTYLEPDNQYTVKFTKDANAHKGLNFNSKVVGSVKAGQTVTANAVATVNVNSYDHYYGVARLQLANGSYVTANKSYFTVINNNNNTNNDNSESNKANNNFARDLVLFK